MNAAMREHARTAGGNGRNRDGLLARLVQRKCECGGKCGDCAENGQMQRSALGPEACMPVAVHHVLRSPGRPLDPVTRQAMESRFAHDFSAVRVHNDASAAEAARSLESRAFTAGSHIAFGRGQLAPLTSSGAELLAHELTHVVQQAGARAMSGPLQLSDPSDSHERTADAIAHRVASGGDAGEILPAPASAQRKIARAFYQNIADLYDPNFCYRLDEKDRAGRLDTKRSVAQFKALLNVKSSGDVTATTTVQDHPSAPGGSFAGSDAILFGMSDGSHTGGAGGSTKVTDTSTEYAFDLARSSADTDVYIYVKYFEGSKEYTFAEIKYSPRVTTAGGKVVDTSTVPTIRVEHCNHLKPSGAKAAKPQSPAPKVEEKPKAPPKKVEERPKTPPKKGSRK
jgi:hypothetical protein